MSLWAVRSSARLTPPGVREGRNAMERFPERVAADGTTSFCTGGSDGSICTKGTYTHAGIGHTRVLSTVYRHTNKHYYCFGQCVNNIRLHHRVASHACSELFLTSYPGQQAKPSQSCCSGAIVQHYELLHQFHQLLNELELQCIGLRI